MSDHEAKLEELFECVRNASPQARDELLDRHCAGDPAMREQIKQLLEADERSYTLLDRSPFGQLRESYQCEEEHVVNRWIGRQIGPFTITGHLGSGGTGIVFEAEQERPRRRVALKLQRPTLLSSNAIRRITTEAEILGNLHHPNIAHVYDAGVYDDGTGGTPYFAMEYIDQVRPITSYAAESELSIEDRLRLFVKVCDAVHHGHQKGVVHRDLKPANILVDASGEPKVIDFGVARLTDSDITVTTQQTDLGQLIGTVQYMSPEQCEGRTRDVDIRSDVYSLGVVLYQLLTGELPYETSMDTLIESTRIVCEAEPQRLSAINRKLRGDLETIVLKSLEKEPHKRYQSALALAEDVHRYLGGEPIHAKPASHWQKTARWIGRHPVATTATVCLSIAATVLLLTFASVWYLGVRPHEVALSTDGRTARLVSIAGHTLHTWETDADQGILVGKLVHVPDEFGGGKLVLIGYSSDQVNPYPASLCAFDVDRPADDPVWIGRLEKDDLPARVQERGFDPDEFRIQHVALHDIFRERSGPQIVVAHRQHPYSQTAIRVYDVAGNVLYQAWHDGPVSDSYWMKEPGLLILAGVNGLVYWEEREHGCPDEVREMAGHPHPQVVFAVLPHYGHRSTDWICPDLEAEDIITPQWYRCIMPPSATRYLGALRLRRPSGQWDGGKHVALRTNKRGSDRGAIHFVLNARGEEITEARVVSDRFVRRPDMPEHEIFRISQLPPIRETLP